MKTTIVVQLLVICLLGLQSPFAEAQEAFTNLEVVSKKLNTHTKKREFKAAREMLLALDVKKLVASHRKSKKNKITFVGIWDTEKHAPGVEDSSLERKDIDVCFIHIHDDVISSKQEELFGTSARQFALRYNLLRYHYAGRQPPKGTVENFQLKNHPSLAAKFDTI